MGAFGNKASEIFTQKVLLALEVIFKKVYNARWFIYINTLDTVTKETKQLSNSQAFISGTLTAL